MTDPSRRGFLAALAGAVIASRTAKGLPPNPVLRDWPNRPKAWRTWNFWKNTTLLDAGEYCLLDGALDADFLLRSISLYVRPETPLRGLRQFLGAEGKYITSDVYEGALTRGYRVSFECDGNVYFDGPAAFMPFGLLGEMATLLPQPLLIPKGTKLTIKASGDKLDDPVYVSAILNGELAI